MFEGVVYDVVLCMLSLMLMLVGHAATSAGTHPVSAIQQLNACGRFLLCA